MRRRSATVAARISLGVAIVTAAGCTGSDDGGDDSAAAGGPVESFTDRGPVQFRVTAEPGVLVVGQRLRLTLEAVAADGVEVIMPVIPETIGSFEVRSKSMPPDVPEPGARRFTHVYELDTFKAGEVDIVPFTLSYTDRRSGGEGATQRELLSDPLPISVRSVLAADEVESDYRDIKTTVAVPVETAIPSWALAAGAVILTAAVLGALLIVLSRRRARRPVPVPPVPAHVWARRMLDRLEARRLLGDGRFHEFYFELSGIVRKYIERRFDIMAPERTTEEFLRETRRSSVLGDEHKTLLAGFLVAADMVKFALHEPSIAESEAALAAARRFVEQTTPAVTAEAAA